MRNFKILAKLTIAILLSAFQASAQTDIKNLGEILYAEKNYKVSSTISDSIYEMVSLILGIVFLYKNSLFEIGIEILNVLSEFSSTVNSSSR